MPESEKNRSFRERINDVYRIEIVDLNTLEKIFTFSGKPKSIITIFILSLIVLFGLFYLVFAFTPLRKTMPGYGDVRQNSDFLKLRKEIVKLENQLIEQQVYTDGLRVLLSNDVEGVVSLSKKKLESEAKKIESDRVAMLAENKTTPKPKMTENPEQKTDPSPQISLPATPRPEVSSITKAQIKEAKYTKDLDNLYFVTPVAGLVSAGFDISINHYGTDIVAPKNTPIKAIASGVIIAADWTRETGNTISIQHPNNIITHYKHNSSLLKNVGDLVHPGEAVAIIGNTGELTDGPHLHFEFWYNGVPVDPENFFTFK